MYERELYISRIMPFLGKPVIKVITGMRRVGKSTFLRLLIERLKRDGVPEKSILYINKESLEFEFIKTHLDLNRFVADFFQGIGGKKYLLVDEVQEIDAWEKTITSLANDDRYDIIITGSNAHLLSSEIATLISGRYVELPIYALGFGEFLEFRGDRKGREDEEFRNFLKFGGLPAIHHFDFDEEVIFQYINSLYNTILLKDVVKRHGVRNVALLENITRYVFGNVGAIFSANRISLYLRSQRMNVGVETIQNYISCLCDTYALHRVRRYDIKGKRHLEISEKYYLGDIGLRHALIGFREADISGVLENLVFLELLRRGFHVSIGKLGDREIDFIAEKGHSKIYLQVAYLLSSPEVVEREFSPLKAIEDNYPKYVISLDEHFGGDLDGIQRIGLTDFLLSKDVNVVE